MNEKFYFWLLLYACIVWVSQPAETNSFTVVTWMFQWGLITLRSIFTDSPNVPKYFRFIQHCKWYLLTPGRWEQSVRSYRILQTFSQIIYYLHHFLWAFPLCFEGKLLIAPFWWWFEPSIHLTMLYQTAVKRRTDSSFCPFVQLNKYQESLVPIVWK